MMNGIFAYPQINTLLHSFQSMKRRTWAVLLEKHERDIALCALLVYSGLDPKEHFC